MALFKTRKGGDEPQATHRQPESVEAIRTRARHRLIGAGVLVLIAVVGFPVLFDTQPRPIAVDIPIQIPDRNKAKPASTQVPSAAQAPAVSGPVTTASAPLKVAAAAPSAAEKAPAAAAVPATTLKPQPASETKPEPKAETKPEPKAAAKPEPKIDDGE